MNLTLNLIEFSDGNIELHETSKRVTTGSIEDVYMFLSDKVDVLELRRRNILARRIDVQ
jgi:hypothetical protein